MKAKFNENPPPCLWVDTWA